MTDQTFELRLQAAYDVLASEATVEIDPITLAAVVANENARPLVRLARLIGVRPSWLKMGLAGLLLIIGLLGAAAVGGLIVQQLNQFRGVLTPGPDMSVARDRPIVVALGDGRVVIAGGQLAASGDPISAEIFDPRSGAHSNFAGDIPTGFGSGLLLPDGRVLIASFDASRSSAGRAGIYLIDPESMTTRFVSLLDVPSGTRQPLTPLFGEQPAIALLQDGNVLLVADASGTSLPSEAFVFDPIGELLTQVGSLAQPRIKPSITTLKDGRVLVAGGIDATAPATVYYSVDGALNDAELYDPATGQFSPVGTMPSVRGHATGFLLSDGRVLIQHQGDNTTRFGAAPQPVALDVFDPVTGTFSALPAAEWPGPPSVTQLVDGRLLLTGMQLVKVDDRPAGSPWAAIYDPITGLTTEQQPSRAIFPRGAATPDGLVVLAGGFTDPPLTLGNPAVPWTDVFR